MEEMVEWNYDYNTQRKMKEMKQVRDRKKKGISKENESAGID